MSIIDDLREQFESFRNSDEKFQRVHSRVQKLTSRFEFPGPDMAGLSNFTVAHPDYDIPVRLYVPHGAEETSPCLVFFHGGGFVACSVDTHDGMCRRVALASGHRVLSVEYRLAPKFPFPAAIDDCERVLLYALSRGSERGIDGDRITVGGDSAGGNMAAYLAQKYRRDLHGQVLFYPLLQMAEKRPKKKGWQDSFMLGEVALNYIEKAYVVGADVRDPRISPMFEPNLMGLPAAFILTCELDPLRDEGRAYADKLDAAGIRVARHHEKAMPHGFLNFSKAFPAGRQVPLIAGEFLRSCFPLPPETKGH